MRNSITTLPVVMGRLGQSLGRNRSLLYVRCFCLHQLGSIQKQYDAQHECNRYTTRLEHLGYFCVSFQSGTTDLNTDAPINSSKTTNFAKVAKRQVVLMIVWLVVCSPWPLSVRHLQAHNVGHRAASIPVRCLQRNTAKASYPQRVLYSFLTSTCIV